MFDDTEKRDGCTAKSGKWKNRGRELMVLGKECLETWTIDYLLDREEKEIRGKCTYGQKVDW